MWRINTNYWIKIVKTNRIIQKSRLNIIISILKGILKFAYLKSPANEVRWFKQTRWAKYERLK